MRRWGILFVLCLCLVACNSDKKIAPKEGRLSLQEEVTLSSSKKKIDLGKTVHIQSEKDWSNGVASAQGKNCSLPAPILGDKNIYTLDSQFTLRAHSRTSGDLVWETPIKLDNDTGLAIIKSADKLLALSTKGHLVLANVKGKILWQKDLHAPFRNQPKIQKERIYLLSANNDVWVLNLLDGNEVWHYKTEAPVTFLQQMGSPAVSDKVVVAPFSSGEIIAFDKETGTYLWSKEMTGAKTFNQVDSMTQMTTTPITDKSYVYLMGHTNKSGAFNLKDGNPLWTIPYGTQTNALLSGNVLFMLTNDYTLLALDKENGHIFWQQSLPEMKKVRGLFLVEDHLYILSQEKMIVLGAKTGKILEFKEISLDGSMPIVSTDGWYYLTQKGKLIHQGTLQ